MSALYTFGKGTPLIKIYLLAMVSVCCCTWAFSCGEQGLLFTAVCSLLIAVASLVVKPRV